MTNRFPTPTKPGYYWAKWKVADDGPNAEEYRTYLPFSHWEPMDVFENSDDPDDPQYLKVHISGVSEEQSVENFFWGPELPARLVDLPDGVVAGETAKAYRFILGDKTVWLPKSRCEWDPDARVMTLPEWLAMDKGLV